MGYATSPFNTREGSIFSTLNKNRFIYMTKTEFTIHFRQKELAHTRP
jgi:hypothetical protein